MQQTDKCNAKYEAQLNAKHEKLRQQLKYLETLQQNIIELNHQLEIEGNKESNEVGAFGILRQNTNYRSLPMGTKLCSLPDDTVQQLCQRTNAQHCHDTQKLDMSTYKDATSYRKTAVDPSSGNNLSTAMVDNVSSSSTFPLAVNNDKWNLQAVDGMSHSENLRNTSYRMIDRFAMQPGGMHESVASCIPANAEYRPSLSSAGYRSSDFSHGLSITAEPYNVEHICLSKDTVYPSLQPGIDETGPDVSVPLSRVSANADRYGEHFPLPDVIGLLSDSITQQNVTEYDNMSCSGFADTMPTLSVPVASKVPPPVAQKPKFRLPCSAGNDVTSCDSVAVSTQPTVLHNMSDEPPQSKSGDLSKKMTFYDDDGQDLTDSSKLVSRLTYKPTVMYPVRRRRPSVGEGCEFPSICPSGDLQSKESIESLAEDSAVYSEENVSRVQTVKNKLRPGMSRRVQFEPLALLLDAALEGEIDLLQTTLKV